MAGWIKLHRDCLDHWLYTEYRPLTRREAWETILLTVNFEPSKSLIKGAVYDCGVGQSLLSLESWAKRFVWSVQQVRTFFKLLELDKMIATEGLQYTTRLTVCNWDSYQYTSTDQKQTNNTPITDGQQAANRPLTTIKEVKEEEEVKEWKEKKDYKKTLLSEIYISDFPNLNNDYLEMAKAFQGLFIANQLEAGIKPTTTEKANGKWVDDIRLMVEADGVTTQNLRDVYTFLQADAFWKQNILSTSKLREKYPTIKMKIHNGNKQSTSNGKHTGIDEDYKRSISERLQRGGSAEKM